VVTLYFISKLMNTILLWATLTSSVWRQQLVKLTSTQRNRRNNYNKIYFPLLHRIELYSLHFLQIVIQSFPKKEKDMSLESFEYILEFWKKLAWVAAILKTEKVRRLSYGIGEWFSDVWNTLDIHACNQGPWSCMTLKQSRARLFADTQSMYTWRSIP
jgi:hypothetical protein